VRNFTIQSAPKHEPITKTVTSTASTPVTWAVVGAAGLAIAALLHDSEIFYPSEKTLKKEKSDSQPEEKKDSKSDDEEKEESEDSDDTKPDDKDESEKEEKSSESNKDNKKSPSSDVSDSKKDAKKPADDENKKNSPGVVKDNNTNKPSSEDPSQQAEGEKNSVGQIKPKSVSHHTDQSTQEKEKGDKDVVPVKHQPSSGAKAGGSAEKAANKANDPNEKNQIEEKTKNPPNKNSSKSEKENEKKPDENKNDKKEKKPEEKKTETKPEKKEEKKEEKKDENKTKNSNDTSKKGETKASSSSAPSPAADTSKKLVQNSGSDKNLPARASAPPTSDKEKKDDNGKGSSGGSGGGSSAAKSTDKKSETKTEAKSDNKSKDKKDDSVKSTKNHSVAISNVDDADSDDLPSEAELAHLNSFYSSPSDAHPSKTGLRILTANKIDSLLATKIPFLLYVYDSSCTSCALYSPMIETLANVINQNNNNEEKVRIYIMNDSTDYKPGFLNNKSEEEINSRLPIIQFFPQSSTTDNSVPFTELPTFDNLISFLSSNSSQTLFNKNEIVNELNLLLPELKEKLLLAGKNHLSTSNDWNLFLNSPCGETISSYSLNELLQKFLSNKEIKEETENSYQEFLQCMKQKENDAIKYFNNISNIANETLQALIQKQQQKQNQMNSSM